MKKAFKKIVIVLSLLIAIGIAVIVFMPDVLYSTAFGQKIMLQMEGDQVAEFYFKDNQKHKDTVYMKGVIYSNTLNDIKRVIREYPEITTLVMEDVPGSIDDETNLAASKEIRKHHINTYLPKNSMVASGGTDMFLAGEKRAIHETAKLGVHSWGGGEKAALDYPKSHEEHKKYLQYYREMNIPAAFYWYTLEAAPADTIHWMTPKEIKQYEVVKTSESDLDELLAIQKMLASDEFEGRGTGNNQKAQDLITSYYKNIKLKQFNSNYKIPFTFKDEKTKKEREGTNIIGYIKGNTHPEKYFVIGADYDHLGIINDTIYNGADDYASGTAALLVLAKYFSKHAPKHSIIFAAFDAEELGIHGSKNLVEKPPVPLSNILVDFNFDMISRNPKDEIYVVGTYEYPQFKPLLEKAAINSLLKVSYGHDNPNDKTKDYWMNSSDNGPFFQKGIPNITFSEEDHPDYHISTDDFESTNPQFYKNAVRLIIESIEAIDQNFPISKK